MKAYHPTVFIVERQAEARGQPDICALHVFNVVVQLPAAGGDREYADLYGGRPHEFMRHHPVVFRSQRVLGLGAGQPVLLLDMLLGLVVFLHVMAFPIHVCRLDLLVQDRHADPHGHHAGGVDGQMGQVFLKGQIEIDGDVHDGNLEGHAQALPKHVGEHAALRAGALVQGHGRGATQGDQLSGEFQIAFLAVGEGGALRLGGIGREVLLPLSFLEVTSLVLQA